MLSVLVPATPSVMAGPDVKPSSSVPETPRRAAISFTDAALTPSGSVTRRA